MTAVAAVMLLSGLWIEMRGPAPASAAPSTGLAQIVTPLDATNPGAPLNSGGSATAFSLKLPGGAACTGDSPNAGYRIQSFMVPSSVDPTMLTFNASGPVPAGTGAGFRQPLFSSTQEPYVNAQTPQADTPGGPGPIINIPTFNFAVFAPGDIPAGSYLLGIACTLPPPMASQLDRIWSVRIDVATTTSDSPAQVTWQLSATQPTTTSSTSTSSPSSTSTTTSTTSTTSTTLAAAVGGSSTSSTSSTTSSTTTAASSSTSSTTSSPVATTTTDPTDPTDASSSATTEPATLLAGTLPRTGLAKWILVWSLILLLSGWATVRLSRAIPPSE